LAYKPQLVFPSHKTLTKEALPCMMKHTLEKNNNNNQCIVLITSTFDLYMNKGAFDTFALVFNFLTLDWEPKTCHTWFIRSKRHYYNQSCQIIVSLV
jgi:hypothetical protein